MVSWRELQVPYLVLRGNIEACVEQELLYMGRKNLLQSSPYHVYLVIWAIYFLLFLLPPFTLLPDFGQEGKSKDI